METLIQDLRYALRMMVKVPGFTAVAVLTLALGIGANTAIFTVVHALLLRPLPYGDADRLVRIYDANQERGVERGVFSPQDLDDLRNSQTAFQDVAAFSFFPGNSGGTLIGVGQPHYISAADVSGNFFSTLQASAALGRTLLPRDDVKGQGLEIVLSYGFWQRQFGGDPNVIGRTVTVDSLTSGRTGFTIVGVMPPEFHYPSPEVEAWAPLSTVTDDMVPHQRGIRWMSALGRLKPGVALQQAQVDTSLRLKQLENAYPTTNAGWGSSTVISLRDSIVGNVRPALLVLFGVVALVMLIACANIANLLLARGTSRTREIAVRSAFGAERRRLVRQLLTESLLMAMLGSAAGLLLALGMLRGLLALSAGTIPNSETIAIDPVAILFCVGAALVVWPLFALLPAWKSSSTNIVDALKEGARGASSGPQRTGMREMLVVGEIAMAAMLLVGSGLLLNSLWRLVHVDPGFRADRVLSLHLTVPAQMFTKEGRDEQYRNEMIDSVARVPGVLAVGGGKDVPLNGSGEPYEFGITPFSERGPIRPSAGVYIVTPGYFQALQIPLKSGRTFTRADDVEKRNVVVVNDSMARKIWGGEYPVGKVLYMGTHAIEVIGVVADVRNETLSGEARDTIYIPTRLAPRSSFNLFIRTNADPLRSVTAIRQAIWSVDKDQAVSDIATMQQVVSEHVAQPRFFTILLSVFGALAITLAAIGAYGVISYSVRERTQEFGIRMALGADRGQVLGLVLKRAMRLVAMGLGFGLIGALITTRFLSTLLFGVKPMDLATFIAASILLLGIALLASYVPARWATRVNPAVALRNE